MQLKPDRKQRAAMRAAARQFNENLTAKERKEKAKVLREVKRELKRMSDSGAILDCSFLND